MINKGIYIHIPFCKTRCTYCNFYSQTRQDALEAAVDGLIEEWQFRQYEVEGPFDTIYLGGGTPSVIPAGLFARLASALPVEGVSEFTIEVNPDDVTPDKISAWKSCGVNRVSMGIQSLDDGILRLFGRRHSASQALQAIDTIASGGISNISADLIYGVPGLSIERWERDVTTLSGSPITHLSAYCLTFNEGTPMDKARLRGDFEVPSDDDIAMQFDILRKQTSEAGFEHYEISNFARVGYRSQHNSAYWDPQSVWVGLGASAHSFDGKIRRVNPSDLSQWLKGVKSPPPVEYETELDMVNDNIVTALRTADGLDLSTIPDKYRGRLLHSAFSHISRGDIYIHDGRMYIRQDKWLISDLYLRDLILI